METVIPPADVRDPVAWMEGYRIGFRRGLRRGLLSLIHRKGWIVDSAFLALLEKARLADLDYALDVVFTADSLDEVRWILTPTADLA